MWTHGENHLKDFLEHLNQAHPIIRFTADWSPDSVSFLDVTITLKDGEVQTDLYSKPTDMHQYLAVSSCYPRHCKQAIPYGQVLRLRRICSEEHQFKQRTTELKQYLIRRGHNPAQVQQSIDKAAAVPRESALQPSEKRKNNRVPLVPTYDPRLPRLSEITKNHLPVLHVSDKLKGAIPEAPIIAYCRPKNLRDLLVRAELKPISEDTRRCKTCQHIRATDTFRSTVTSQSYKVHTTATCKTKNLVYLIECRKCNKQYVGETENALHIRLNGHRSDVKTKKMEKPVAAHFNLPGHSMEDLTIMVFEKIWREDVQLRRRRESYWIHHLRSVVPEGMNLED